MTYSELKEKQENEINNFPIQWAFSKKQAEEGFKNLGLNYSNPEDHNKIAVINGGGFMLLSDEDKYYSMLKRHSEEIINFRADKQEFIKALVYEMKNYEMIYSHDSSGVKSELRITEEDFKNSYILECWNIAQKQYQDFCIEKDLI